MKNKPLKEQVAELHEMTSLLVGSLDIKHDETWDEIDDEHLRKALIHFLELMEIRIMGLKEQLEHDNFCHDNVK